MKYIPVGYFNNIAFGPETELNLVIDSTANLASTKTLLDTLVSTDLKALLSGFYGSVEKYDEKVRVVENDSERPYQMLTTFNLSSRNSFVFAFIDEASPYGDIYTTANAAVTADVFSLVNKVSSYNAEYRGFIFRVKDMEELLFKESHQLREVLNTVHNNHFPYNETQYFSLQVPETRENQIFNKLDIADDSELTRFADAENTEMTSDTRYKYYGFEILESLNSSIATLNLNNDNSVLMTSLENTLSYDSRSAIANPFNIIGSRIPFTTVGSEKMDLTQIGSRIPFTSRGGLFSQFTEIKSRLTFDMINNALTMHSITNLITYSSTGGTPQ